MTEEQFERFLERLETVLTRVIREERAGFESPDHANALDGEDQSQQAILRMADTLDRIENSIDLHLSTQQQGTEGIVL